MALTQNFKAQMEKALLKHPAITPSDHGLRLRFDTIEIGPGGPRRDDPLGQRMVVSMIYRGEILSEHTIDPHATTILSGFEGTQALSIS